MAESEGLRKLREKLECGICLERYIEPKSLQCSHAFCKNCLFRLPLVREKALSCPQCRKETVLSDGGVADLEPAFQINNLLDIESSFVREKDATPKKSCESHKDQKISMFCETCQQLICQECTINTHHGHKYNLISDAFKESKEELETLFEPAENELERVSETIDEYYKRRDDIRTQKDKIEREIYDVIAKVNLKTL